MSTTSRTAWYGTALPRLSMTEMETGCSRPQAGKPPSTRWRTSIPPAIRRWCKSKIGDGSFQTLYVYGLGLVGADVRSGCCFAPRFYGFDGHGSVRFLTDATGKITDTYD